MSVTVSHGSMTILKQETYFNDSWYNKRRSGGKHTTQNTNMAVQSIPERKTLWPYTM
jgi:hypothetical protein